MVDRSGPLQSPGPPGSTLHAQASRFVHLPDPSRRKEMMIIYAEALAPTGKTAAQLSQGGALASEWPAMADALSRRARTQISLTRAPTV